ncbi:MAG: hypothetical protein CM1200mP36_10080 [Gammaproteobacteria bacterium]|nr:MAG: hypothetical protein CM1200mP36_10080 [Gammaproteobacteria bacterium]
MLTRESSDDENTRAIKNYLVRGRFDVNLTGFSVEAHHSGNMFDRERTVELTGTVKEFQWTNPHIWIQVLVPTAGGGVEEWSIEGGVPNRLFRAGWRPKKL